MNTAIVQTWPARSDSIEIDGGLQRIKRQLDISGHFSPATSQFPTPLKDVFHSFLYHLYIVYFRCG